MRSTAQHSHCRPKPGRRSVIPLQSRQPSIPSHLLSHNFGFAPKLLVHSTAKAWTDRCCSHMCCMIRCLSHMSDAVL